VEGGSGGRKWGSGGSGRVGREGVGGWREGVDEGKEVRRVEED